MKESGRYEGTLLVETVEVGNLNPRTVATAISNLLKHDGPAGLVTFLVALPLCLGIALGSGAPSLYRTVFSQGWDQFIPFLTTVCGVVFTDLLKGVLLGALCGFFFIVRKNHHEAITVVNNESTFLFQFTKDATFVNKDEFRRKL